MKARAPSPRTSFIDEICDFAMSDEQWRSLADIIELPDPARFAIDDRIKFYLLREKFRNPGEVKPEMTEIVRACEDLLKVLRPDSISPEVFEALSLDTGDAEWRLKRQLEEVVRLCAWVKEAARHLPKRDSKAKRRVDFLQKVNRDIAEFRGADLRFSKTNRTADMKFVFAVLYIVDPSAGHRAIVDTAAKALPKVKGRKRRPETTDRNVLSS